MRLYRTGNLNLWKTALKWNAENFTLISYTIFEKIEFKKCCVRSARPCIMFLYKKVNTVYPPWTAPLRSNYLFWLAKTSLPPPFPAVTLTIENNHRGVTDVALQRLDSRSTSCTSWHIPDWDRRRMLWHTRPNPGHTTRCPWQHVHDHWLVASSVSVFTMYINSGLRSHFSANVMLFYFITNQGLGVKLFNCNLSWKTRKLQ